MLVGAPDARVAPFAIDGVGLTFLMDKHAAPHLASGQLARVLEDWCEPFAGYFLYYPSRRPQTLESVALSIHVAAHGNSRFRWLRTEYTYDSSGHVLTVKGLADTSPLARVAAREPWFLARNQ